MRLARRQAGFTIVEMAISVAIFGTVLALLGQTLSASSGLSSRTRVNMRVAEGSRQNLEAISDLLRGGSVTSLTGFVGGTSTDFTFQCVTGGVAGVPTLGAARQIKWLATTGAVNGVTSPGRVVAIQGGVATTLAPRVPAGGFVVTQQGRTLLVNLTTYYSTSEGRATTRTDRVSVTLRN